MEKYEKDGNVAILYSPGYGAGWSTWNQEELSYDKRVVEFFINHRESKKALREESLKEAFKKMGYEDVYFGGYDQIQIMWIPKGKLYRITEYDGWESIHFEDTYDWRIA